MQITIREPGSAITHCIGMMLAIFASVPLLMKAGLSENVSCIASFAIFIISMVLLYGASTLYHSVNLKGKALKLFKKIDHMMIFVLIAGTYTPYTLVALRSIDPAKGWMIFSIVWGIAIFGTLFYLLFKNKFKILNVVSYIVMGWVVLIALPEVLSFFTINNAMPGLYLLVAGGIAYTVGVIFYALQNLNLRYFHSIWHLFVLAGSICHFLSVTLYIL